MSERDPRHWPVQEFVTIMFVVVGLTVLLAAAGMCA